MTTKFCNSAAATGRVIWSAELEPISTCRLVISVEFWQCGSRCFCWKFWKGFKSITRWSLRIGALYVPQHRPPIPRWTGSVGWSSGDWSWWLQPLIPWWRRRGFGKTVIGSVGWMMRKWSWLTDHVFKFCFWSPSFEIEELSPIRRLVLVAFAACVVISPPAAWITRLFLSIDRLSSFLICFETCWLCWNTNLTSLQPRRSWPPSFVIQLLLLVELFDRLSWSLFPPVGWLYLLNFGNAVQDAFVESFERDSSQ